MHKQHAVAVAVVAVDPLEHVQHQHLLRLEPARDVATVVGHPVAQPRERCIVEPLAVVLERRDDGLCDDRALGALDEQADQEAILARMPRCRERRLDVSHEVGDAAIVRSKRRIGNEKPCRGARGREMREQHAEHARVDKLIAGEPRQ